jgi:hypothetical protein
MYPPYRLKKYCGTDRALSVGMCPCSHTLKEPFLVWKLRQDDDADRRDTVAQQPYGFESIVVGDVPIEEHDIGMKCLCHFDRFCGAIGFTDNDATSHLLKNAASLLSELRVVIYNDHVYHVLLPSLPATVSGSSLALSPLHAGTFPSFISRENH